jgi:hypothetical protein
MAMKRSIIVRGCPEVNEYGAASETIKPGYLVKGVTTLAKQTASGTTKVPKALALAREELGQGIDNAHQGSGTSSAFYASGDVVKVGVFKSGEEALVFVPSGQNIVEDDLLESAGTGLFVEGANNPLVRAMESLGAVTVETALRVQWL